MISLLLILVPVLGSAGALLWPHNHNRSWFIPTTGGLSVLLAFWLLIDPPAVSTAAWLGFDPLARAVLPAVALLFFICGCYAVPYLRSHLDRPNRIFVATFLALYALINTGLQARHLGLLWIATEGATLAAVPLIHFNGTPRAFEATWKYLLVGGTGVALSLLGSFCLGYASLHGGGSGDLTFVTLVAQGSGLSRPWVLTSWVLLLVGYGTKMGMAPMHTWKPDVYGEAPGIVGAVLAGGVTTLAFASLLRIRSVIAASGEAAMADRTLLLIGLFSTLVAALFLLGTRDHKRMLAYSSVEHMGILSLGAALGPLGVSAALFHVWSNTLTKGALFLSASNLRQAARSASMDQVRGMASLTPASSALFVAGLFAVTACPPFGPFFSELQIVHAGFATGHAFATVFFLLCLLLAFFGLTRVVFGIVYGRPSQATRLAAKSYIEHSSLILPPLALLLLSLALGLHTPEWLRNLWAAAVAQLYPALNS